jgi:hypothetical protein
MNPLNDGSQSKSKLKPVIYFVILIAVVSVGLWGSIKVFNPATEKLVETDTNQIIDTQGCPGINQSLIGRWIYVDGEGFFEEFSLDDQQFNAWQQGQPVVQNGQWRLEHCELVIEGPNSEGQEYRFEVLELTSRVLRLYHISEGSELMYNRMKR